MMPLCGHRFVRVLRHAATGPISLCIDTLGREVVHKRIGGRARSPRQLRALLRVRHPNVARCLDIGECEGHTVLVMEYVPGRTLSECLAAGLEPQQILSHFIALGRGLAAMHELGLVHRDVKPDNVLIGDDGVARLIDFGLVLEVDPTTMCASEPGPASGTGRYMALEQRLGQAVDARADQFSYCASLYEALWRRSPFEVPCRVDRLGDLHRIVRRGLAREPDERWPSMGMVVEAIEGALARRRRRMLVLLLLSTFAVSLVGGV